MYPIVPTLLVCMITFRFAIAGNSGLCSAIDEMRQACNSESTETPLDGYRVFEAMLKQRFQDVFGKMVKQLLEELDICKQPNDICPEGWTKASNGACFKLFRETVNHAQAKSNCLKEEAGLATTVVRDAYSEVQAVAKSASTNAWIGLNDIEKEGRWLWEDGIISNEENTPWAANEPNDQGGEDCAHVWTQNWNLNDYECEGQLAYLCEKRA